VVFADASPARRAGLPIDAPIAETWAVMSVPDPLPFIDGLLAATAKVHSLTLVTRNVDDVAQTGVPIVNPFAD
jgi:predicted nucleic acid-binding protein